MTTPHPEFDEATARADLAAALEPPDDPADTDRVLPLGWRVRSNANPAGLTLDELEAFVGTARAAGLPGTSLLRVETSGLLSPYRLRSIRTAQPRP